MAANITDEEWDELSPENFDTTALLSAVDAVDELRSDLNNNEDGAPPQLRDDLLKLHQLARIARASLIVAVGVKTGTPPKTCTLRATIWMCSSCFRKATCARLR